MTERAKVSKRRSHLSVPFKPWKNPERETLTVGHILRGVVRIFTKPSRDERFTFPVDDDADGCCGFPVSELGPDIAREIRIMREAK